MLGALARMVMPGHGIRFLSFFLAVVIVSQIHMHINSQICRMGSFNANDFTKLQKSHAKLHGGIRGG